ncbi:recombinase RecT [bacterium]|nr:recombinase RecT [bacterium]
MAEENKKEERKQTMTDFVANIYRQATEFDAGKILTIARSVIATIKKDNKLLSIAKNNRDNFVNCINNAISLGLPIDENQYCYLVPYGQKLQLQIGYKGYIYKIKQSYPHTIFQASLRRELDEISFYKEKNNDYIDQKYNLSAENQKIIGAYCIITFLFNNTTKSVAEYLDRKELDKIKGKAKTKLIWNEWEGEMCKKSAIRRACKIHFPSETKDLNEYDNKMYDITPKPKKLSKTAGLDEMNQKEEND